MSQSGSGAWTAWSIRRSRRNSRRRGDGGHGPVLGVLAVNLGGVVLGMKYTAPVMIQQGSGSIVNVASIGGRLAGWSMLDYSAAKAAVIQLTRWAASELGEHAVQVNSVSPGPVATGLFGRGAGLDPAEADQTAPVLEPVFAERLLSWQPIRRPAMAEDIAPALVWLAAMPRRS